MVIKMKACLCWSRKTHEHRQPPRKRGKYATRCTLHIHTHYASICFLGKKILYYKLTVNNSLIAVLDVQNACMQVGKSATKSARYCHKRGTREAQAYQLHGATRETDTRTTTTGEIGNWPLVWRERRWGAFVSVILQVYAEEIWDLVFHSFDLCLRKNLLKS